MTCPSVLPGWPAAESSVPQWPALPPWSAPPQWSLTGLTAARIGGKIDAIGEKTDATGDSLPHLAVRVVNMPRSIAICTSFQVCCVTVPGRD